MEKLSTELIQQNKQQYPFYKRDDTVVSQMVHCLVKKKELKLSRKNKKENPFNKSKSLSNRRFVVCENQPH